MNYSNLNRSYADASKSLTYIDNLGSSKGYYSDKTNQFGDEPSFMLYQEGYNNNLCENPSQFAIEATKGILVGVDDCVSLDPVTKLYFSAENVARIQKMIRREVYIRTNGQYKLETDQDESDLMIAMRAVFFDMYGARFLPFKIVKQVKELNRKTINYIMPDMITQMKQSYGYLKEINQPLNTIMRPINANHAGRRTLPSITTIWGL
jgi:hypothetical protein